MAYLCTVAVLCCLESQSSEQCLLPFFVGSSPAQWNCGLKPFHILPLWARGILKSLQNSLLGIYCTRNRVITYLDYLHASRRVQSSSKPRKAHHKFHSPQINQFHNHAQSLKVEFSGRPLDKQTWQTECTSAPLAQVQLCEQENKLLLRLAVCIAVAPWKFSRLATARDCETSL